MIFDSVKGRTLIYNISPVLTSAESLGPKAEHCSSTVHT